MTMLPLAFSVAFCAATPTVVCTLPLARAVLLAPFGADDAAARGVGRRVRQVAGLRAHGQVRGRTDAAEQLGRRAAIGARIADADAHGGTANRKRQRLGLDLVVAVGQHIHAAARADEGAGANAGLDDAVGLGRGHRAVAGEAAEARRRGRGPGALVGQRAAAVVVVARLHADEAAGVQHRSGAEQRLHGRREGRRGQADAGRAGAAGDGQHIRIGLAGGDGVDGRFAARLDQRAVADGRPQRGA